jgi:hypothetical protein
MGIFQLGRPSKTDKTKTKRLEREEASERNAIEGKFGEGKRSYGLGLIRARLPETSETVIALQARHESESRKCRYL